MPAQPGDDRRCQWRIEHWIFLRSRNYGTLGECELDHVQRADAVLVQRVGDEPAIVAQIPIIDVPFRVRQQIPVLPAREIDICEALELRFAIGRDKDAFAIFRKEPPRIRDRFRAFLWPRSNFLPLACLRVEEPEVALVN